MTRRLIVEADGGSRGNPGPAGYGAVVRDAATASVLAERAGFLGVATNNVAEYQGLIAGLEAARRIDPGAAITVRMDSKLVVEQLSGRWQIKHPDMKQLAVRAKELCEGTDVAFEWVPRASNKAADALANEAMDSRSAVIARDFDADGPVVGPEYDDTVESVPVSTVAPQAPANARGLEPEYLEPLTLILVRHGVTDLTTAHRLSGSSVPGPGLNATGRIQAARAADAVYRIGRETWDRVAPVSRIVASPMTRTQETAGALGRRLGLAVESDARVREVDFGAWEGLTAEEAIDRDGDGILRWQDGEHKAPEGESISDVGKRGGDFLAELARVHAAAPVDAPATVAVVSHAVAIKALVGVAMGFPVDRVSRVWPVPASVTIMQVRVTPAGDIADCHLLCLGSPTE